MQFHMKNERTNKTSKYANLILQNNNLSLDSHPYINLHPHCTLPHLPTYTTTPIHTLYLPTTPTNTTTPPHTHTLYLPTTPTHTTPHPLTTPHPSHTVHTKHTRLTRRNTFRNWRTVQHPSWEVAPVLYCTGGPSGLS